VRPGTKSSQTPLSVETPYGMPGVVPSAGSRALARPSRAEPRPRNCTDHIFVWSEVRLEYLLELFVSPWPQR
jgi:hypothetical protein